MAEVIKRMMACQQQGQQQGVTGAGPTVTEIDDNGGTDPNFPNAPSPSSGPPNNGWFGVAMTEVPQVPTSMEIVPRL